MDIGNFQIKYLFITILLFLVLTFQISSAPFLSIFSIVPNVALIALLFVMYYWKDVFNEYSVVVFLGSAFGIFNSLFSEYPFFVVFLTWILTLLAASFLIKNRLAESRVSFLFLIAFESFLFLLLFFGLSFVYNIGMKAELAFWNFKTNIYFTIGQIIYNLIIAVFFIVLFKLNKWRLE